MHTTSHISQFHNRSFGFDVSGVDQRPHVGVNPGCLIQLLAHHTEIHGQSH